VRDLFYTTKEVGRGSGLGLAMVHNVAEAHGGRLVLENVPSGGLRAALVLPLAPAGSPAPGPRALNREPGAGPDGGAHPA
jgi:signal transduction histidine kinase